MKIDFALLIGLSLVVIMPAMMVAQEAIAKLRMRLTATKLIFSLREQ